MDISLDPHLTRVVYAKVGSGDAEHVVLGTDATPPAGHVPVMLVTLDKSVRFSVQNLPSSSLVARIREELWLLRNSEVVDASSGVQYSALWADDLDDVKKTAQDANVFGLTAEEVLAAYPRILVDILDEVAGDASSATAGQRVIAYRLAKVALRQLGGEDVRKARMILEVGDASMLVEALQAVANIPSGLHPNTKKLLDEVAAEEISRLDPPVAEVLLQDATWLDARSPGIEFHYAARREAQLKLLAKAARI